MAGWRVERFGCFGKLPVSREFLVEGARDLGASRFDRWIGEGLGLAKAHLGARYDRLIDSLPAYRFLWPYGSNNTRLLGVIEPSIDAAGRKHPFSVFALVEGRTAYGAGASTAVQVAPAHHSALRLIQACRACSAPQAVLETVRTAPRELEPVESDLQRYRTFLKETSGEAFWSRVEDGGDVTRHQLMQCLIETLAPLRSKDPRGFRGGIRIPLGAAPGGSPGLSPAQSPGLSPGVSPGLAPDMSPGLAPGLAPDSGGNSIQPIWEVSYWLDWIEHWLGRSLDHAWWFWSGDGEKPALYVFFSEPSGVQWSSLMDPTINLESISYLDRPYGGVPPANRMFPALKDLLESKTGTLDTYLHWASAWKGAAT